MTADRKNIAMFAEHDERLDKWEAERLGRAVPMFRGESEEMLVRRLILRDWPEDVARKMAAYLCDPKSQPPRWHEIAGERQ